MSGAHREPGQSIPAENTRPPRFIRILDFISARYFAAISNKQFVFFLLAFWLAVRWLWVFWTPAQSSALEEAFYELTAARNWLAHGFGATDFLPDYAAVGSATAHPMVYTHFPPLPALLAAFWFKLGLALRSFRCLLAALNVAGIYFFYRFLDAAFGRNTAVMGLLFSSFFFNHQFIWNDNMDYSFSLLVLFLPASLLYGPSSVLKNYVVGGTVFLTSLLNYKLLVIQIALLIVISRHSRPQETWRLLRTCIAAAIAGIGLHLAQNIAFFGWKTASQELILTLQNRIFGSPSTAELAPWFNAHNIVLWGAPKRPPASLFMAPLRPLFAELKLIIKWSWVLFVPWILGMRRFEKRIEAKTLWLLAEIFLVAAAWSLVFPAHELGYGSPTTESIAPLVLVCFACGHILDTAQSAPLPRRAIFFATVMSLCALGGIRFLNKYRQLIKGARGEGPFVALQGLTKYRGSTVWTNISSIYPQYFMDQTVPGRCTIQALSSRSLSGCLNILSNSKAELKKLAKPQYFVFSDQLLSGNMLDSTPERLALFRRILDQQLTLIEKNNIYSVYEFKASYRPRPPISKTP